MPSRITTEPIDAAAVLADVGSARDGAVLLFLGTVRDHNDGRPVRGMRYDAYVEMAEPVLASIVAAASSQFEVTHMAAVHRIGELAIGEVSVAVAVSSPHRAAAFDAARHVMEEIKLRLPVWKHEHYVDGAARWLDGAVPPEAR